MQKNIPKKYLQYNLKSRQDIYIKHLTVCITFNVSFDHFKQVQYSMCTLGALQHQKIQKKYLRKLFQLCATVL